MFRFNRLRLHKLGLNIKVKIYNFFLFQIDPILCEHNPPYPIVTHAGDSYDHIESVYKKLKECKYKAQTGC